MPSRRKGGQAEAPAIVIEWAGKTYTVRHDDMTPRMVRDLRRETGHSWAGLNRELMRDADIDLVAALIWLGRRLDGQADATYDAVLDELDYESAAEGVRISVSKPGEDSEDDLPPA